MSRLCCWAMIFAIACWSTGCGSHGAHEPEPQPSLDAAAAQADSDDDGLADDTEAKLGTSPLHADTDGDGFSDYDEVIEKGFDPQSDPYKFNPRIADVPQLDIEVSNAPQVHFLYTTREGKSQSIERGRTTDRGWSTATSKTLGSSVRVEVGVHAEANVGFIGKSPTASVGGGWSRSEATEESFQWSETASQENRLSLAEMRSEVHQTDKDKTGSVILVGVKLHNRGNVQLDVKTLRLIAVKVSTRAPERPTPIGLLELDTKRPYDLVAQVAPHKSTQEELMFSTTLNLSQMEQLLQDGSLVIRVADFALAGMEAFTDINAKTASVVIDPGPREDGSGAEASSYLVAVHSSDGKRGISVGEALRDVLHLKYETGASPWKYGDRASQTRNGLRALMGRSNNYELNGYWVVSHTRFAGSRPETVDYNPLQEDCALDDLRLHSGDTLQLTYVQDTDRDGLGQRTELMLGTNPRARDTDADGLTDGEEVAGWMAATDAAGLTTPRRLRSSPTQSDSDGDGLSDFQEKKLRTDPLLADTDGDNVGDSDDAAPLSSNLPYHSSSLSIAALIGRPTFALASTTTDARGNIFFAGTLGDPDKLINEGPFVAKCDAKSQLIWRKPIGPLDAVWFPTSASLLACGPSNEVFVGGILANRESQQRGEDQRAAYLASFTPTGQQKWLRLFNLPPAAGHEPQDKSGLLPAVDLPFITPVTLIELTELSTAGGFITLIGNMKHYGVDMVPGRTTPFIVRWDFGGKVLSTHLLDDWRVPVVSAVVDNQGTVYGVDSKAYDNTAGPTIVGLPGYELTTWPVRVFALDASGKVTWSTDLGEGRRLFEPDIAMLATGDLVVAATDTGNKGSVQKAGNVFLARITENGQKVFEWRFRFDETDRVLDKLDAESREELGARVTGSDPSAGIDRVGAIAVDDLNQIFVAGRRTEAPKSVAVWAFDAHGRWLWETRCPLSIELQNGENKKQEDLQSVSLARFSAPRQGQLLAVGIVGAETRDTRLHLHPFALELTAPK